MNHQDKLTGLKNAILKTPSNNLDKKILGLAREKLKPQKDNQWLSFSIPVASMALTLFFLVQFTQKPFETNQEIGFYENLELIEYQQSMEHFDKIEQLSDEEWKLIIADGKGI